MSHETSYAPDSMPTLPPRETPQEGRPARPGGTAEMPPRAGLDSVPTLEPQWRTAAEWSGRRWKPGEAILGRYVVESELGHGGMGVVYGCFDKVGGVRVAVKALPPELSRDAGEMEEIRENFQLVYRLGHPNIAGARTLEKDANGEFFLVMELAEGESLRRWMRRKWREGGIAFGEAASVLRQVASALDYAHEQKVVHRDVKPENVMIDVRGRVKVLDFGLAEQIRSSLSRVSQEFGGTSGTRPYMAPEQWEGKRQDARTDQYALGAMAYEMLSGFVPFTGSDPAVLREAVLHGEPDPVEGLGGAAMAALRRALAKTRAERWPSCTAFVDALEGRAAAESTVTPQPRRQPVPSRIQESGDGGVFLQKARLEKALAKAREELETGRGDGTELERVEEMLSAGSEALKSGRDRTATELFGRAESVLGQWRKKSREDEEWDSDVAVLVEEALLQRRKKMGAERAKLIFWILFAGWVPVLFLIGIVRLIYDWVASPRANPIVRENVGTMTVWMVLSSLLVVIVVRRRWRRYREAKAMFEATRK